MIFSTDTDTGLYTESTDMEYTTTRSPDQTTVRQLNWTPIYEALVKQQMRSLDRPYIYTEVLINCLRMQASVVYAAEDTLSQARAY